ncbi:MAG: hydroxyacid dehydrogenase [Ahrensia sp.]|nr:hydroxyacid dehydrogenase [Ahrensia sp.]
MAEVVISEFMDEAAVARIAAVHSCLYAADLVDRPDDLAEAVGLARALIVRNRTQLRGALLEAGGKLECVGRLGVGLDNIDVAACRARSIDVYPATGANDLSVAEYVITCAQMLLRNAYGASNAVIAGEWPRQAMIGRELAGKTVGLIGFGAIARQVAGRAMTLGCEVVAFDPMLPADDPAWAHVRNVSLDGIADLSDVVSLHVPLTEATRHMVDLRFLKAMRSDAVLINAARGGAVDDAALALALSEGEIAGAALDVFETEPLTAEAGAKFAGLPNFIATPHIAGVTEESNVRVSHMIADLVLAKLGNSSSS